MKRKIRVLVVDDSALVRQILVQGLNSDPTLEVVGAVNDPYEARDAIVEKRPDVLTLDVEMPRMNGVDFLRRLMPQYPLPVIMVSSLTERGARTTLEALEAGAVDFVAKPRANVAQGLDRLMSELRTKVKIASTANVAHWKGRVPVGARAHAPSPSCSGIDLIAIGASTGGTEATRIVLERLPRNTPPIVIVQHMPEGFTAMYANRMNQQCPMRVCEAAGGERLESGTAYIAQGGRHMRVVRRGGALQLVVEAGETVEGHCPSVDVLFHSVATVAPKQSVGVLLTGIGRDGAKGLKAMREQGARCYAQDEATSVVFGMPKEAHAIGAAESLVAIDAMADAVLRAKVSRA